MPFYPPGMAYELPLTPPEMHGIYPSANPLMRPVPSNGYPESNERFSHYSQDKFGGGKQLAFGSGQTLQTSMAEHHAHHAPGFVNTPNYRENVYGNIGAPLLPPIKAPDVGGHHLCYRSEPPAPVSQAAPKQEEKPVGGVAATLDYEMEQMVDFVSEMAQGIVQPSSSTNPRFRSFVSQILTSTRLPSSTILLALNYLSTRMTGLASNGYSLASNGDCRQMLTTSLMLASKFLDDNTFQNRSWAEVSNIAVVKLNEQELEWLDAIGWDLHIDPMDRHGFTAWLNQWAHWKTKKLESTMDSLKLTPLDASLRNQQMWKQAPPTPIYTPTYQDSIYGIGHKDRSPTHWQQWPANRNLSPLSAPHTGLNTPEWYARAGGGGYGPQLAFTMPNPLAPAAMLPPLRTVPSQSPFYNGYGPSYMSNAWGQHNSSCMCGYCAQDRYMGAYNYGMQSVAG